MTISTLEQEPIVMAVTITEKKLLIDLEDGCSIAVPLDWYPRLLHGTMTEKQNYQLLGGGYAIEWPDLDEHIEIEGLLGGRQSSESQNSLQKWLVERRSK